MSPRKLLFEVDYRNFAESMMRSDALLLEEA